MSAPPAGGLRPLSETHPVPEEGPFACVAHGVLRPERRAEALEIFARVRAADDDEPGTLVQAWHAGAADPGEIWIYELWESREALEHHRANLHDVREQLAECFLSWPTLSFCTPITAKGLPVDGRVGDGRAADGHSAPRPLR